MRITSKKVYGSVLAMSAASSLPAAAQNAMTGFTIDVQGGYDMSGSAWNDKLEAVEAPSDEIDQKLGFDDTDGYNGSIRVTKSIDEWRDIGFAVNGTHVSNERSFSDDKVGEFTLNPEEKFTSISLDAEYGVSRVYNGVNLRAFAGIRYAKFETTLGYGISQDKLGDAEVNKIGEFSGIGPRVGVNLDQQFAGSQFGWFGNASGSALFGSYDTTLEIREDGSRLDSETISESGTAYSLDASLGVSYYMSEKSRAYAGYRVEKYWNVLTDFDEDDLIDDFDDRLVHGPFIGFTTQF